MTDSEKIETLQKRVGELEADRAEMWRVICNLRDNPPMDLRRLDRVMLQRYSMRVAPFKAGRA